MNISVQPARPSGKASRPVCAAWTSVSTRARVVRLLASDILGVPTLSQTARMTQPQEPTRLRPVTGRRLHPDCAAEVPAGRIGHVKRTSRVAATVVLPFAICGVAEPPPPVVAPLAARSAPPDGDQSARVRRQ